MALDSAQAVEQAVPGAVTQATLALAATPQAAKGEVLGLTHSQPSPQ